MIINTIKDLYVGRVIERYYDDGIKALGMVTEVCHETKKFSFEVIESNQPSMIGSRIEVSQFHSDMNESGWRMAS